VCQAGWWLVHWAKHTTEQVYGVCVCVNEFLGQAMCVCVGSLQGSVITGVGFFSFTNTYKNNREDLLFKWCAVCSAVFQPCTDPTT
jgi:hypothetical protein